MPDKANYLLPNSYRYILVSDFLVIVYEKIIQPKVINILYWEQLFWKKKLFAYQKNQNSSQALLSCIEQMSDAILSEKYGIAVMADFERAFDTVWRKGTIYKLCKAGINNNLLSAFSSFLSGRFFRNLVNSHISDWSQATLGVPQGHVR